MPETQYKVIDISKSTPITRTVMDTVASNMEYLKSIRINGLYTHEWWDWTNQKKLNTGIYTGYEVVLMSGVTKLSNSFNTSSEEQIRVDFPSGFNNGNNVLVTTGIVAPTVAGKGVVTVAMTQANNTGFTATVRVLNTWSTKTKRVTTGSGKKKKTSTQTDLIPDSIYLSWVAMGLENG